MRLPRPALFILGAAASVAAVTACSSKPTPSDPVLAKGQQVYAQNCASCHGADGEGGAAPRLIGIATVYSEAQQRAKIEKGVTGSAMPAWKGRLTDEEITAVLRYTREELK